MNDCRLIFDYKLDTSAGTVRGFHVQFTTVDQPFDCADKINARFDDLTEARSVGR